MQDANASAGYDPTHAHGSAAHAEPGFWRQYIFSTDHKVVGIQYGVTALLFLFFGFLLMALMRWQLAYPGQALPVVGELLFKLLGGEVVGTDTQGRVGLILPDLYNSFGAMHGTVMVFLAVVPL